VARSSSSSVTSASRILRISSSIVANASAVEPGLVEVKKKNAPWWS